MVILCGGRGTRLGALTAETPKPLLPVAGAPFLFHRLSALKHEGAVRVILSVHYLADQFRAFVQRYADRLPAITVVEEPEPLGTGGALRLAAFQAQPPEMVVMNGDSWLTQPLAPVLSAHAAGARAFTMVVIAAQAVQGGARRKGLVALGPQDTIAGFVTPDSTEAGWVNGGLYVVSTALARSWPEGRYDLEARLLSLVPEGRRGAFRSERRLLDIGTPECYAQASRILEMETVEA